MEDRTDTHHSPTSPDKTPHYTDSLRKVPWQVLKRTEYQLGMRLVVVEDILSPDGTRPLTWTYFNAKHAVLILAVDEDDHVLLVREYRHPLGSEIFNIPAGGAGECESEEELQRHAARELAEETSFTAREWSKIGVYHPVPAMSPALHHIYLARGLEPLVERGTSDDWCEIEEVVRVPFHDLYEAAVAGEIMDGLTLLTLLWAGAKGALPTKL